MSAIANDGSDEHNFKTSYCMRRDHKAAGTIFKITNVLLHFWSLQTFDERLIFKPNHWLAPNSQLCHDIVENLKKVNVQAKWKVTKMWWHSWPFNDGMSHATPGLTNLSTVISHINYRGIDKRYDLKYFSSMWIRTLKFYFIWKLCSLAFLWYRLLKNT